VKGQLALPEDSTVTGETKFVDLGADSLDTVCNSLNSCDHLASYNHAPYLKSRVTYANCFFCAHC
jgi:hypothetical protein